jgi:hypothetical protein
MRLTAKPPAIAPGYIVFVIFTFPMSMELEQVIADITAALVSISMRSTLQTVSPRE